MNQNTQRWVDKWLGIPLCLAVSVGHQLLKMGSRVAAPRPPESIMVVLLSEMGSLVLAYPMLQWLKEQYPQATLHALMFAKNKEVIDLLDVKPPVHVLTIRDTGLAAFAVDVVRNLLLMRKLRIDTVVDCELFSRVSSLLSGLSGAKRRVGFFRHTQEGLYRGSFMTQRVLYNPHRHIANQFLTLAAAIGSSSSPPAKERQVPDAADFELPRHRSSAGEIEASRQRLAGVFGAAAQRRLILVYPSGGALPIRAWPLAHYEVLCNKLLAHGFAVGIIGLPSDRALSSDLVARVNNPACHSLAGYTANVGELLTLFQHADLLISNDGGPGHFAAMVSLPTLMFFGPETPKLYRSLSPKVIPIHEHTIPCSPCVTAFNHRESPCDGDNQCLKRISPDRTEALALKMLADASGRPVV